VVSPSDQFGRLCAKVWHYLERSVKMVWVADPEDRSVTVYRAGVPAVHLTATDMLDGADALPGFSVRVAELFAA
jgi:Uma2 family endonuclease